jgi:hypothetical protein
MNKNRVEELSMSIRANPAKTSFPQKLSSTFQGLTVGKGADFATIQSAIDTAKANGGGTIYLQPGTYQENLVLAPGITLEGCGIADLKFVVIEGQHILPETGEIGFNHIFFSHPTATFISGCPKGNPNLLFRSCVFEVDNGYTLNIPTLRGTVIFFDCLSAGNDNGFILNSEGACVPTIFNITIGSGVEGKNEMKINSDGLFFNVHFRVKVVFGGEETLVTINGGSWCENTITVSDSAYVKIANTNLETGSKESLLIDKRARVALDSCSIESTALQVVKGEGMLRLGNVSFSFCSKIADSIRVKQSATYFQETKEAGCAGDADPLPAAPAGYVIQNINGAEYLVPYYLKP